MANYGPPGDGSPEPWGGRRSHDPYGAEARGGGGWGDSNPEYPQRQPAGTPEYQHHPVASPGYPPAQGAQPGYRPAEQPYGAGGYGPAAPDGAAPYQAPGPPAYTGDPTPPSKRGRGVMIAVLAGLAVFVLAGGGTLYHLLRQDDPAPAAAPTVPAGGDEPGAATGGPAPTVPAPESSADPRFVKVGQCVRNEGTGGKPKLAISACAPKTYEVLRRFDGATSGEKDAEAKCAKVGGYTNWYFFDSELDTLDFVLCLRLR